MDEVTPTTSPPLVSHFGYANARGATDSLAEALGFQKVQAYATPEGDACRDELSGDNVC
jgi:hypothetical protein